MQCLWFSVIFIQFENNYIFGILTKKNLPVLRLKVRKGENHFVNKELKNTNLTRLKSVSD